MRDFYGKIVEGYAKDVSAGRIVAGRHVRYATDRYLWEKANQKSLPFELDDDIATRACKYFDEYCCTTVGVGIQPFLLQPWQAFVTWNLMGWRWKSNRLRRFRRGYVSVAAKSGKTTWAAGIAKYLTFADEPFEYGANVFVMSTTLTQSMICYNEAVKMVALNPELNASTEVYKSPHRIEFPSCGSVIRPFPCNGKIDGYNLHGVIKDEIHAWTEHFRDANDKIRSRMLSRRQPLEVTITTAGSDKSLIWQEEDAWASRNVEAAANQKPLDDTHFSYIARLDEQDDPFDSGVWIKANPSIGVTVAMDAVRTEANQAKEDPKARNRFTRYMTNRKVSSSNSAILPHQWEKGSAPLSRALWDEGYGGVDLARTRDFAAIGACFPIRNEEGAVIRREIISRSWVASQGRNNLDQEPFRSWIRDGKLGVIDGDQIIYDELEEEIVRWAEVYNVNKWDFDPSRAAEIMNRLMQNHGLSIHPMAQTTKRYNEPCTRFVEDLSLGKVIHGDDEVLTWQAGNLEFYMDHEQLVKPNKNNVASKIDGMVAVIMAFGESLFSETRREQGSMYIG